MSAVLWLAAGVGGVGGFKIARSQLDLDVRGARLDGKNAFQKSAESVAGRAENVAVRPENFATFFDFLSVLAGFLFLSVLGFRLVFPGHSHLSILSQFITKRVLGRLPVFLFALLLSLSG